MWTRTDSNPGERREDPAMINDLQVTRKSVPTQIIEHLQESILSGRIPAGTALPSERELAARFQVSRNTLRQAITYLEAKNLVYTRHGAGVFVVDRPQDAAGGAAAALFGEDYTIRDILEGRLGVEPLVAELAAQRRTEEDLAGLVPFLTSHDEADPITVPGNFHSRLARATGNPVLAGVCKTLNTGPEQVGELLDLDREIVEIWDQAHRDIYEAVRDRDAARARDLMHEHMLHTIAVADQLAAAAGAPRPPAGTDRAPGSVDNPLRTLPVVFLPGINNTAATWAPVVDALHGAGLTAQAVDLPALDGTDRIVADLAAALPDRFTVVGHSFGGYVALELLAAMPERVAAIGLVNSSAAADTPAARAGRARAVETAAAGGYADLAAAATAQTYHPRHLDDPALMAARDAAVSEYGVERYIAHQQASAARRDHRHTLAAADRPALVIAADADTVIPTAAQRAMAEAAGARYTEIGPAGHMLPAEQPAALADALIDWLT